MFEAQTGELPRVEAALTTRTWKSEKGKTSFRCLLKILSHLKEQPFS